VKIKGHIGFSPKKKNSIISNIWGAAAFCGQHDLLKTLYRVYGDSIDFELKTEEKKGTPGSGSLQKELTGATPLMLAVAAGDSNIDIVKWLIEDANADTSAKNWQGDTILHIAVRHNCNHIVSYLICANVVDPFQRNMNGESAVSMAQALGLEEIQKILSLCKDNSMQKIDELLNEIQEEEAKKEKKKKKKADKKARKKKEAALAKELEEAAPHEENENSEAKPKQDEEIVEIGDNLIEEIKSEKPTEISTQYNPIKPPNEDDKNEEFNYVGADNKSSSSDEEIKFPEYTRMKPQSYPKKPDIMPKPAEIKEHEKPISNEKSDNKTDDKPEPINSIKSEIIPNKKTMEQETPYRLTQNYNRGEYQNNRRARGNLRRTRNPNYRGPRGYNQKYRGYQNEQHTENIQKTEKSEQINESSSKPEISLEKTEIPLEKPEIQEAKPEIPNTDAQKITKEEKSNIDQKINTDENSKSEQKTVTEIKPDIHENIPEIKEIEKKEELPANQLLEIKKEILVEVKKEEQKENEVKIGNKSGEELTALIKNELQSHQENKEDLIKNQEKPSVSETQKIDIETQTEAVVIASSMEELKKDNDMAQKVAFEFAVFF